ncbi:MAG: hypothetical protein ACRDJE_16945, partial [Dehalococcoidia bacterium]
MNATNLRALVPVEPNSIEGLAQHFVKSGFFKNSTDLSKAIVNILYGQEVGIGPVQAMMAIHVIDGKPTLSANLLATLVKRSGRYDYRIREHTAKLCRLEFFENRQSLGPSEFTIEEAQAAGLMVKDNWKKYPKAMLFSRAISQGVRWHCPDVTGGAPAYTPEELGAEVDEDGEVVEGKATVIAIDPRSAYAFNRDMPGANAAGYKPPAETDADGDPAPPHPRATYVESDADGDGRPYFDLDGVLFCIEATRKGPVWATADLCTEHGSRFYAKPLEPD